jgi:hypothetical protein
MWEEKIKFLFITYYKYSIFENGKLRYYHRLFKHPNPKYLKAAIKTEIVIGKKQFQDEYNGNKWTVPINIVVDLNLK